MNHFYSVVTFGLLLFGSAALADDKDHDKPKIAQMCKKEVKDDDKHADWKEPKAEQSITQHRTSIGGKAIDYTAIAGSLVILDDDDKPIANMGYVAYTKRDVKDSTHRPIMFAFNGGPGSASLWLHMGALGPRRVVVSDPHPTPPAPYTVVDNEFSVLDKSDLVMIDPVGTGISHAVCDKKDEDFWGVDPDIDSVSRFIAQFVSDNNRWGSPKFLLGESYGTTRAAAVADYLFARRNLSLNGLVLVSVATDLEVIFAEVPGNDRPYAVYLPGYTAAAWYHHKLPDQPPELGPLLTEVRHYALGPFNAALMKGDSLPEEERNAVAEQLHRFTGLSIEYLKAANLRVSEVAFSHELLKSDRQTVGRLDARFKGPTMDLLEKYADYDPQSSAISAAYTAAFMDYYHSELKFGQGKTYRPSGSDELYPKWKWTHQPIGSSQPQPFVNTGVDLAHVLVQDASLRVLVLNGYFDLATPFSATEYVMSHLNLPPGLGDHITLKYYEAGHMMYLHPPSLKKMKTDLDAFMESTQHP